MPKGIYTKSPDHIAKIIHANKTRIYTDHRGSLSFLWKGGKSFEPYPLDWTRTLKRSIRERDKYMCQLCGELQDDRAFDVHHIDYNKSNCNPNNLITLCMICHIKTNSNRKNWKDYFSKRSDFINKLFGQ